MNILIIGFGSIGKRHAEILSSFDDCNIELVTKQKVIDFTTYYSLEAVTDLNKYDYFIIATETHLHFSQLSYLENKVSNKLILVEKPLFNYNKEIEIKNNQVFVAYNLRFHPIIQKIKNWLKEETVISVNITVGQYLPDWRPNTDYRKSYSAIKEKGGGVLLDLSHEIDYIQWLFGKISSFNAINKKISNLEITSDDYLGLVGKTINGTYLTLNMDYLNRIPTRNIIINTSSSSIKADLISGKLFRKKDSKEIEEVSFPNLDRNYSYSKMHQEILKLKKENICTFEEGLSTIHMINSIQHANNE